MTTLLTLRSLLRMHGGALTIPPYQRRYVWGRRRPGGEDSAACLIGSVIRAYRRGAPLFLQGLTVTAGGAVVDGQQRLTCLCLMLRLLRPESAFTLDYPSRPAARAWMAQAPPDDADERPDEPDQDVYLFRKTLRTAAAALAPTGINRAALADFILDNIHFLYMRVDDPAQAVQVFMMMNGTKSPMLPADVIKADIIRLASDERQPGAADWELSVLSARYAARWDEWAHWWERPDVREYFGGCGSRGIDLLLNLCLCADPDTPGACDVPLSHGRFRRLILDSGEKDYHAAKHFFDRLDRTQRRLRQAYDDPAAYNRLRAVLLLQRPDARFSLLHAMFVTADIPVAHLDRYYRLSFLGMDYAAIRAGSPARERFDDLYATLSLPDVYHGEGRREAFQLLLRLNIDEDIKLGRRFDFSVWDNRSLEHIYSKSKVWHADAGGRLCDGNGNELRQPRRRLESDPAYICRDTIRTPGGLHLSEHCIGNLVLLYGQNNAEFGNAEFEEKKRMFLRPGDREVFRSRNLLHSVCVFAGESWTAASIVDNYLLTLRNLRQYYGFE